MSVNTEIWGPLVEDNNWKYVFGDSCRLTKTVGDTLLSGNDKHTPLDSSVCLFGFGINSPFQNTEFVTWDYENHTPVTAKPFRNTIIPWALGATSGLAYGSDNVISPVNDIYYGNAFRWLLEYPEDDASAFRYLGEQIEVNRYITDFDYQRKFLVIIRAVSSHDHTVDGNTYAYGATSGWMSLDRWLNYYRDEYDMICQIGLVPTNNNTLNTNGYFSLFTNIPFDMNVDYPEQSTHYGKQLLPKNWYAYRLNGISNITYKVELDTTLSSPCVFLIAGAHYYATNENERDVWVPFFKPTVGNWSIHSIARIGEYGFFSTYDPGSKTDDEIIDDIAHIVAHMGTFFIFDIAKENAQNDDRDVFLGILSNGISTGEYTRGIDNRNSDQFNWEKASESPFNPSDLGDQLVVDTGGSELRQPIYAMIGGYSYIMGGSKFVQIWEKMIEDFQTRYLDLQDSLNAWKSEYDGTQDATTLDMLKRRIDFSITSLKDMFTGSVAGLGADPNNAIKSILCFPFDLTPYISTSNHYFKWGFNVMQDSNIGLVKRINGLTSQFWVPGGTADTSLDTGTYVPKTRSFLDFAPYTTSQLYIPYCGCVDIDPAIYVGKSLEVRYLVDYITGACTALVYAGNDIIDQISGNMAVNISLSSFDTTSYMDSIWQGNQAFKVAKGNVFNASANAIDVLGDTIKSGSLSIKGITNAGVGVGNSMVSLQSANYQLATAPVNFKQIMYGSSFIATGADQRVRLFVYRPMTLSGATVNSGTDWGDYGHTVGFACLINNTITDSGITGYLQGNIDTSGISATETEKEMIRSLLASGVYV